jgi:Contact-dependent growth inhibition CdiA C-terminal domain
MINPGEIPQIPGDIEAVAAHAATLKSRGKEFGDTGSDVHSTWQGLSAFYSAPEAAELFAATGPVKQKSAAVGADVTAVGAALATYADEVRPIKARLSSLQSEAETFARSVKGDDDWRKDGDKVNQHNGLLSDVNGQVAAWMAAQRTCANAINALFGGTRYVEDNGDGTRNPNEFGYSKSLLDQATAGDDGVPWGKPEERDKPWYEDAIDAVVSFGKGVVVDGLWGTVKGLGNLVGFGGWDGLKQSWGGLLKLGLALSPTWLMLNQVTDLPGLPKGTLSSTLEETGKGLLAWDTWKDDPARASGNVVFNVVSIVFGTKGAGATTKGLGTAAKGTRAAALAGRVSVRVSELVTTVLAKFPHIKLPEFLTPKTIAHAYDEDFVKNLPDGPGKPNLPEGKPDLPDGPGKPEVPEGAGKPDLPEGKPNLPDSGTPDLPHSPDRPSTGQPHPPDSGGTSHGSDAGPSDPPPARPIDQLPEPKVGPPEQLPRGVTDDPATWPGRIVQDHLDPRYHFSLDEESIAKRLAQTSPGDIEPIPRSDMRTADASVAGKPVEFKTLEENASSGTVKNTLAGSAARGGQSDDIILDARGTNLGRGDAIKGLARFLNAPDNIGKYTRVRIWGSDFDLDWKVNE